jgi:hypothetical protein
VVDPVTFLTPDLDVLLQRLVQSDATKWQALRELGLDAAPASRKPARTKEVLSR